MQMILQSKAQYFQTQILFPPNHALEKASPLHSKPHILEARAPSQKAQCSKSVISLRKNRRRNGSQRLIKFMLEAVPIVASNLKILPQPLDLIIGELGGGSGNGNGGVGSWRGSGGGWFGGWRRGGRRKLGFWWVFIVFGLGLLIGSGIEDNVLCGILCAGFIGVALVEGWSRRAIRDGILGFCLLGALLVFGLRKELQTWIQDIRVCSPLMTTWSRGGRRRKSRRAL